MAVTLPLFAEGAKAGGFAAGLAAVPEMGAGLLVAAAVTTLIAVGSQYTASRIWQEGMFNNVEIGAKSTAHHIAQELKAGSVEFVQHTQESHPDGKHWQEYIAARATGAQHQSR